MSDDLFSGIVSGTAPIISTKQRDDVLTIQVDLGTRLAANLEVGASVAIDGVCLTATEISGDIASFDLIEETVRCTTLGAHRLGTRANVERSLKYGDEVGGHPVSGHVSAASQIVDLLEGERGKTLFFEVSKGEMPYIMPKGFIAIDGISLTVGEVDRANNRFNVHLIPETLSVTTIGSKVVGDLVNVELDSATVAAVEAARAMLAEKNGV